MNKSLVNIIKTAQSLVNIIKTAQSAKICVAKDQTKIKLFAVQVHQVSNHITFPLALSSTQDDKSRNGNIHFISAIVIFIGNIFFRRYIYKYG